MTKSIIYFDAGKDCKWSISTEEKLMEKVTQYVIEEHKEIELD